jgi:hypothetical protein
MSTPKCPIHKCNMRTARIGKSSSFWCCPKYHDPNINCKETYSYEEWKKPPNVSVGDENANTIQGVALAEEEYKNKIIELRKKATQESLRNRKKEPRWLFNPYRKKRR